MKFLFVITYVEHSRNIMTCDFVWFLNSVLLISSIGNKSATESQEMSVENT